ncbi:hypothetical protein [Myroides phaeus]|uniref:hypothetical protein n=1 Tax=Myroides phaeus TaxID=702745 RepID=UPI001302F721|nr:hypothetical protein [Myroides phaeus]
MKNCLSLILLLCSSLFAHAQEKCSIDYEIVNDSTNVRKTNDVLVYEDVQEKGNNTLFFSLIKSDDNHFLHVQLIQKSQDFIPITCINYRSIISFKLNNGRVLSAYYIGEEKCDTYIYDKENKNNIRILSTSFLLKTEDLQYLRESPLEKVQVRYANQAIPYTIKNELESTQLEVNSQPSAFFIDNIPCLLQ